MSKYILAILTILLVGKLSYAKQITLNIPDDEIKIVENDVLDAENWLTTAWKMKVAGCRQRMIKQEIDQSIKNQEPIPAGEDAILEKALKRPGYESRKQREKRLEKEWEATLRASPSPTPAP